MILRKSKSVKFVWEDDPDKMWIKIHALKPKEERIVKSQCITSEYVNGETKVSMDVHGQPALESFLCLDDFGNAFEDEEKTKVLEFSEKNAQACIDYMDGFAEFVHSKLMILTEEKRKNKEKKAKN
jgi:hypothetical protein